MIARRSLLAGSAALAVPGAAEVLAGHPDAALFEMERVAVGPVEREGHPLSSRLCRFGGLRLDFTRQNHDERAH